MHNTKTIAVSDSPSHRVNKNTHRLQMYTKCFEENGLDDIEYPVNPVDIPHLEERLNISINLYSYFDNIGRARHPMYISRHKSVCKIDLLYFNEHYAWIKNFSSFLDLTQQRPFILLQTLSWAFHIGKCI